MNNAEIIRMIQDELEYRVRTAIAVCHAAHSADRADAVNREVAQGRRAVADFLREPVDVEALAVGTTFKAPHFNLSPGVERLWVRTATGIMSVLPSVRAFSVSAVDPKQVHSVQAPAEDES